MREYGRIWASENPYSHIFYAVFVSDVSFLSVYAKQITKTSQSDNTKPENDSRNLSVESNVQNYFYPS